jgi:hypothetical protein
LPGPPLNASLVWLRTNATQAARSLAGVPAEALALRVCCYIFLRLWITHRIECFVAGMLSMSMARISLGSITLALGLVGMLANIVETAIYIKKPRF